MKIKDIYCYKNKSWVSLMIALMCIVFTAITLLIPNTYHALAYAFPVQYPWQVCSGLFVHGTPEMPIGGTIGHLVFNLLLVLPFGVMIEKIIGSKKFAVLSSYIWIVNIVTFYAIAFVVTPNGETAYGAGISGVAFFYGIIGFYVLFRLFIQTRKLIFKQVSFYLLMNVVIAMLIMVNPIVAGVASMIMHITAIVAGVVYLWIDHKRIDNYLA